MPTASDCIVYGRALDEEFRRIQQEFLSMAAEASAVQMSAYQELDRVTSARAHGRVRPRYTIVDYMNPWTLDKEVPARKKVPSNLSVLAEAERKLNDR